MNYFITYSNRDLKSVENQTFKFEGDKKEKFDPQILNFLSKYFNTDQTKSVSQHANEAQSIVNLEKLFDELTQYASEYFDSSVPLSFINRENTIVMSQSKNEVYMSSVLSTSFLLFVATQVYHSYVLDTYGKDSEEDIFCYRYTLFVLNDMCLNDFKQPIIFPSEDSFGILLSKFEDKPSLIDLACDIFYSAVAFALLHEISHAYLHHNENDVSLGKELEADEKAYSIFLDYCYDLQNNKTDSVFKECIKPYTYMAPMYLLEFYYVIYYAGSFLCPYHSAAKNEMFDQIVKRKEALFEVFYSWDKDIDPTEAYDLYNCYLDGEESFLRSFVASDKAGMLETLKKRNDDRHHD